MTSTKTKLFLSHNNHPSCYIRLWWRWKYNITRFIYLIGDVKLTLLKHCLMNVNTNVDYRFIIFMYVLCRCLKKREGFVKKELQSDFASHLNRSEYRFSELTYLFLKNCMVLKLFKWSQLLYCWWISLSQSIIFQFKLRVYLRWRIEWWDIETDDWICTNSIAISLLNMSKECLTTF